MNYLNQTEIQNLLLKEDKTTDIMHCMGQWVSLITQKLENKYQIKATIEKGEKIVSLEDNYYQLGYDSIEVTLSSRYTKYIDSQHILRTQMTSVIPSLLIKYKEESIVLISFIFVLVLFTEEMSEIELM